MKNILILVLSIILVLSFGIWELGYLEETSDYVLGDASQVQNILENPNKGYNERESAIKDLNNTWKTVKKPWSIYISHGEIDNINERIISYSVYALENNKEEATKEYENLVDNLNHVVECQKLLPQNIF